MSDIIPNVVVSMPSQLFTLARKFQAASNGKIYIGKIDTDPTIPENQIQVYLENEDGSTIPVAQPLIINQAGFPVYNGQIAKFVTVEGHSMAVYDSYGAQQFNYPNVLKYDPDQFEQRIKNNIKSLTFASDDIENSHIASIYTDVYLKGRYVYKRATSVYVVDGIRVIVSADGAVWEIHNPAAIYASDFCHDTDSLQKAYRIATQLNAKFYIDKTFENLLPTTKISGGKDGVHDSVLQILDDSYLEFINDGALKLANTNSPWSNILFCGMGVNNFKIINPVIFGDRLLNTENNQDPMKGQWGYGLAVYDCSNGYIKNPKVYDCLGDGIYVGKRYGDASDAVPTNVLIEYPVITGVRRNGISLCAGDSVHIIDPVISNVGDYDGVVGAWPKSGIDIEPEKASSEDGDVRLINSTITNPT
ncbi:TPA: phage head-binding domain-containing protein, partial [Providencia alcalifaciens]